MSLDNEIAGITCAEVLAALSDYVDGELAVDTRRRIEGHVRGCSNCERFGGMFAEVVRGIRTCLDEPTSDDNEPFERLQKRLETLA